MLWLNLPTGDVIEAPKRPSPAWVTVVGVKIVNQEVESTLEGLRRAMMKSEAYTLRPNDFEWVEKKGLNVYAHEAWWLKTITDADFPYLKMAIASDGTLEIRYDEKAKDDTSKDTIRTKEISEDDSPLKRGGQRGTGKSGQGGGGGEEIPGGEGGEEDGEGEGEEGEGDADGEGEGESDSDKEGDGEDRDAYQEGQESADEISDEIKEKMKEKMQGKGKPADESGPSSGPAPDGSEGGAPTDDPTGEAGKGTGDGQGTPSQGEGGEGDADGGEGQGDGGEGEGEDGSGGDGEPCDSCGKQGEECSCDSPSEDGQPEPTDDPQDASGDGGDEGNIWEQAVALAKEHLEETKKAMYEGRQQDANQNAFSTEMDAKFIKALADAIANDDWATVSHCMKNLALIGDVRGVSVDDVKKMVEIPDSQPYIDQAQEYAEEARRIADGGEFEYTPPTNLPPEEKDALDQCVEEAEDGKDSAEEAMQNADSEAAKKASDQARDAADEAHDIVDSHEKENEGNDPMDNEKVQEAMEYADEAEEFAKLAEELEEEIRELFEESGLDEEDYEEFKEGLLDELFGEDSEFSDELTEREKRLKEKIERREQLMEGRGLVRCVNWETGKIKSFPENETIGDTWIQITKFFSPFETADGKQIVVDRTIEGATKMVKALGYEVVLSTSQNAHYTVDNEEDLVKLVDALKKMRMFSLTTSYTFPNPHSINISY
tara:strand:- start:3520 stop:5664 length:2145 start_codon:yes stop_codon:yes gene_type:complete